MPEGEWDKKHLRLGQVTHNFNLSTLAAEMGRSPWVWGQLGLQSETLSKKRERERESWRGSKSKSKREMVGEGWEDPVELGSHLCSAPGVRTALLIPMKPQLSSVTAWLSPWATVSMTQCYKWKAPRQDSVHPQVRQLRCICFFLSQPLVHYLI